MVESTPQEYLFECLKGTGVKNTLMSYHYRESTEEFYKKHLWCKSDHCILIDSGAFNAFSVGAVINKSEYLDYCKEFVKRVSNETYFFNLDVIGDQRASWANQEWFEKRGLVPIPVVTYGADEKDILRCLKNYDYWALGGLVPYAQKKDKLRKWMDYVFTHVKRHWEETGVIPKIHLLGVAQEWVLHRYPAFSCDASSYNAPARFGHTLGLVPFIPKRKEVGPVGKDVLIYVIKNSIKKEIEKGDVATKLWESRGIVFDKQWSTTGRPL
jgi:hypothetical protein